MSLRDVGTTASMRLAKRWLREMREEADTVGQTLDPGTDVLFEHLMICPECELREHSDPDLCPVADAILDGPDDDEE